MHIQVHGTVNVIEWEKGDKSAKGIIYQQQAYLFTDELPFPQPFNLGVPSEHEGLDPTKRYTFSSNSFRVSNGKLELNTYDMALVDLGTSAAITPETLSQRAMAKVPAENSK